MSNVSINLSPEEARLFMLFRQHQANFQVLVDNHVFDIKRGNVILSYDDHGRLAAIKLEEMVFRLLT